ncbi:MAG: hypothetical protein NC427_02665 [Ruminococcus flavefaciens]|nr:hypothetical protein [Ruminococcus flavefaciens]
MEQIAESLTELLEQEADLIRACSDYLHDGREKPEGFRECILELAEAHNTRFDEVDAQLTRLEGMEG